MAKPHLRQLVPPSEEAGEQPMSGAPAHGHLDFLAAIPDEYRPAVLDQCTCRSYRKGEIIWSQGDAVKAIAFVASGKVFSLFHGANGRSGAVGFWSSGDILGAEFIAEESGIRRTSLRCVEDATIYYLEWPRFQSIVRRFPEIAYAVITALSVRLRWAIRLAHVLQTQTAFNRVCSVLLALAERFPAEVPQGVAIDLDITHEDLAAVVGVSRQFMTITLHELEHRNLITKTRRRITLTDLNQLRELTQKH